MLWWGFHVHCSVDVEDASQAKASPRPDTEGLPHQTSFHAHYAEKGVDGTGVETATIADPIRLPPLEMSTNLHPRTLTAPNPTSTIQSFRYPHRSSRDTARENVENILKQCRNVGYYSELSTFPETPA